MSDNETFRILSLDGGGIRGLITAVWLDALEKKLGGPVAGRFDLIAGTSTGSILACGLSKGLRAQDIIDLYVKRGREVFPAFRKRIWDRVGRTLTQGLSAPKYKPKGLTRALQDVFGQTRFGDLAIKPTLVTSYNTLTRTAVVFKNNKPEHAQLPVWEICTASSSAPTYFPAHVMKLGQAASPLVDGGVVANNPTACAVAEGLAIQKQRPEGQRIPLARFVVASFGTGQATRPITAKDAKEWGALEWAIPIIDVLFDGASDATDYIARQMLLEDHYFRIQTRLDKAFDDMDNAQEDNLNALINQAQNHLDAEGGNQQLEALVKML